MSVTGISAPVLHEASSRGSRTKPEMALTWLSSEATIARVTNSSPDLVIRDFHSNVSAVAYREVGRAVDAAFQGLDGEVEEEVTTMKGTINGLDYDLLMSDPALADNVKAAIRESVLKEVGSQLEENCVQVALSK